MSRRKLRSLVAGALACVLLSGCAASDWRQVGGDAGHSGHNPDETTLTDGNVTKLSETWAVDLLTDASEPMVSGGRVALTTSGSDPKTGELSTTRTRAFETATGAMAWNRDLFSVSCPRAPATDYPDATYVGAELWTGYFMVDVSTGHACGGFKNPVRLDPTDGTVIAEESSPTVSPAVDAGDVVVQTKGEIAAPHYDLVVRDTTTLDVLWTGDVPGGIVDSPLELAPAVADGMIVVGHKTSLHAFPIEGCPVQPCSPTWSTDLVEPVTTVVSATGNPLVYAASGTRFVVVDRSTGEILVEMPLGTAPSGIALSDTGVVLTVGSLVYVRTLDGSDLLWSGPLAADATARPVVAGGVVFVGRSGGVDAFAADGCGGPTSCDPLTSVKVTGDADHVTVADGRLFVVSAINEQATLTAFAPST